MNPEVSAVTDRIIARSKDSRAAYLSLIERERDNGARRPQLGCANLAHAYAGTEEDRDTMRSGQAMNIGIVTAYNDMLSAHAVYYRYPELMKVWAREVGATAQVAGDSLADGVGVRADPDPSRGRGQQDDEGASPVERRRRGYDEHLAVRRVAA